MKKLIFILILTLFATVISFSQVPFSSNLNKAIPDVMNNIRILDVFSNNAYTVNLDSFPVFFGFPVTYTGYNYEGGIYCNMDSDPALEIVYTLAYTVYALNNDGTPVAGWPKTVSSYPIDGAPAFGDIDGDGSEEIVVTNHGATSGGFIHAFKKNGSVVPGFPINHGYSSRTPVLADLDNDNKLEIIVNKRIYPVGEVWVYKGDGTVYPGWPKSIGHVPASSAAVGDIDNDNIMEIVAESYTGLYVWKANGDSMPGFPFIMPNGDVNSYSSPVLVDVDNDNKKEIIFGTHVSGGGGYVYILKYNGTIFPNWPKYTSYWIYGPPAVGYIDNDNILDIAVGDQVLSATPVDKLYAWNVNGVSLSGFPISSLNAINIQVLLADIDNDNQTELIIDDNSAPGGQGKYLAFNHDGTPVSNWPIYTNGSSFYVNPCLFDANRDGILDMTGGGMSTSPQQTTIYIWNLQSPYNAQKMYVPMFQFNPRHNGVYGDLYLTNIKSVKNEIPKTFSLEQNYPNPFNSSTIIKYNLPKSTDVLLVVYDITGKNISTLVNAYQNAGIYEINFEANNLTSGVYFYKIITDKFTETKKFTFIK